MHFCHPALTSPLFNSSEQRIGYFCIIDEVDPSEAHSFFVPSRVGLMVDDSYDTPYHLVIAQRDEWLRLTKLEGCVLIRVKGVSHIAV